MSSKQSQYPAWSALEEAEVRRQVHEGNAGRPYFEADWLDDMKLALGVIDRDREAIREAAELLESYFGSAVDGWLALPAVVRALKETP